MNTDEFKALNRLAAQAADLSPDERAAWLASLGPEHDALKPRLLRVLARIDATASDDFLASPPSLTGIDTASDAGPRRGFEPGTMVGLYRLVRELASGGQGAVWLAERTDGMVDRPVAVKLPTGLARPGLADRMAREREILARLTHPNIARLYDAGVTEQGDPFLALEYVDGVSIERHVRDRRLDIDATLRLFLQVVDAVAYAHGQLVIHRDIKPSNVLVTSAGQARLLDFGIAKLIDDGPERDSTMTIVGGRALTLAYASPEQVAQQPLGVATDVYSLGVVLYELLCGRRPHVPVRNTTGALEDAILHGDPTPPAEAATDRTRRTALRGDLGSILVKALKRAPGDRYVSVGAFGDDVRRYLQHQPVSAQPDRLGYRLQKFVARNRVAVLATAAVMIAIVGGAGVAVWQAREARAQRDRADTVREFMTSVFRDIDPALRGSGRALTATDVLAQAVERLEGQNGLDTEPAVRAELRRVLGASFLGVGDAPRALGVLPRALSETVALHGADSDDAIDTEIRLANALYLAGKADEANAALDRVKGALERGGRQQSELFVQQAALRSEIIINRGGFRKPEALDAARAALAAAEGALPAVHVLRARAHQQLAAVYRWRNEDALAADHAEKAYRMMLELRGGDAKHISVVMAENEFGRALYQAGRTKDALDHLKAAVDNSRESLADDPLLRQHLLGTLANSQLSYGEVKEGLANLDEAVALPLKGVELSPAYIAGQQFVRARAYLAARRIPEALAIYDRSVADFTRLGDTATLATVRAERAEALVRLGRLDEAEREVGPMIAGRKGAIAPAVRRAVWLASEIRRQKGDRAGALVLAREAVDFEPTNTANKIARAQFQTSLAHLQLVAGDVKGAQATIEAALEALDRNQGVMNPIRADALTVAGPILIAAGRGAEGLDALERVNAFWQGFDPRLPEAAAAAQGLRAAQAATPRR